MKLPRKLKPLCLGFCLCAFFASVSVFAARPESKGGAGSGLKFPGGGELPEKAWKAAGLDNEQFVSCVKAGLKSPPSKDNVGENAQVVSKCRENLKN